MSGVAGRLGFPARAKLDYLRRLGRLRWSRRFPAFRPELLDGTAAASSAMGAGDWVVVRDETALPAAVSGAHPANGRVRRAAALSPAGPPIVHTLRELEGAALDVEAAGSDSGNGGSCPAIAFSASDFPPEPGETVSGYLDRLFSSAVPHDTRPDFSAVVFDPAGSAPADPRTEVTRNFPATVRRLLDVGCGAGEASGALRRSRPDLSVTGIERDASAAASARRLLDRVIEGDGAAELAALGSAGERFDGFLFADVLEHFEDPVGALALARRLASPGATLVASVPNAGHISLVRDLVSGRFDPLPAGLADAGHLRWFTRGSLAEALEEAGWAVERIEPLPGAPAPDANEFLTSLAGWNGVDRESLATYQWVAVATAAAGPEFAE